jgi:hypothetical protein
MRTLTPIFFIFLSITTLTTNSLALDELRSKAIRGKVVEAYFDIYDVTGDRLCLTILETENGSQFGIVEDLYDCFYALEHLDNGAQEFEIPARYLESIGSFDLVAALSQTYGKVQYLYSIAE